MKLTTMLNAMVRAKPLMGPIPTAKRTIAPIMIVTLESNIVRNDDA